MRISTSQLSLTKLKPRIFRGSTEFFILQSATLKFCLFFNLLTGVVQSI
jgi:hypothetical protein